MSSCPCGSKNSYESCCGPYLKGAQKPPTAEALMRSRYTAYTRKNIDYVERTHDPKHPAEFDRKSAEQWSEAAEWMGLEIVSAEGGAPEDSSGMVEFIARFKIEGKDFSHHEKSLFRRDEDAGWYYVDGKIIQMPFVRQGAKVGRNDPCSCGSGKKAKKCCGAE